jgi:hypothetical protein
MEFHLSLDSYNTIHGFALFINASYGGRSTDTLGNKVPESMVTAEERFNNQAGGILGY